MLFLLSALVFIYPGVIRRSMPIKILNIRIMYQYILVGFYQAINVYYRLSYQYNFCHVLNLEL